MGLLLETLLLLLQDCLLNFPTAFRQIFEDFTFLRYTLILFFFEFIKVTLDLLIDGLELFIQRPYSFLLFLGQQVFQVLHAVVASFVLAGLVLFLCLMLCVQLSNKVRHLLVVLLLVGFQRLVHFLAFINCVLFDVLNLSAARSVKPTLTGRHP